MCQKNDDRFYYNIAIPGSNTSRFNSTFFNIVPAIYSQQLTQSILQNPCEYYMSIVRFTIPTEILPIFIFEAQPFPNILKDLGVYSVTLEYNGNYSPQTFVEYITTNPTTDIPKIPTADNIYWERGFYYYVYNYTTFLTMINNALADAFLLLPGAPITTPPFLIYNAETQLISLIADKLFYDRDLPIPIRVFFNGKLQRFFGGIPYIFYSINDPLGRDSAFLINDLRNNTYLLPNIPPGPTYLNITQNYNTLSDWNSFKSLKIITSIIPIRMESTPSAQTLQNSNGVVNLESIVTDFEPLLLAGAEGRTTIQYQLDGPYRLINMTDINPLSRLDLQVYWTDELLNKYLVYVPEGQILTIKIAFIKKSSYFG